MTESNQNEIISRLHKLEKQNRYMKLGGLAIVLLVVTTLLTGASKKPDVAEEIRAKKIAVVDEQGKDVIVITSLNNVSRITIFDSTGTIRCGLGAVDGKSMLGMFDSKGKYRLGLLADDTSSSLSLNDSKGKSRLGLGADDTSSSLMLNDSNGNNRLRLSETDVGSLLFMNDSKGNIRLGLAAEGENDNGGKIEIYNKTNEQVVGLGADEYGNGVVGAYNRKGKGRELTPGP